MESGRQGLRRRDSAVNNGVAPQKAGQHQDEVRGSHLGGIDAQERGPSLTRPLVWSCSSHVFEDRVFADSDALLERFPAHALGAHKRLSRAISLIKVIVSAGTCGIRLVAHERACQTKGKPCRCHRGTVSR